MRWILLANFRHLMRHRYVAVLAVLGISLGVAMSTAIDVAVASSQQAFTRSVAGVVGRATHQIIAGPSGISDGAFAPLRLQLSPWPLAPVVESMVGVEGHTGRVLYLTGIDPLSERPFRSVLSPLNGDASQMTSLLITQPRSVVLSSITAHELGMVVGESLRLVIGTRLESVRLVGVVTADDPLSAQALGDLALCDISTAQELMHHDGTIDRIDLIVPPQEEARLTSIVLPSGSSLQVAGARGQALQQMTSAFHINLIAMGLLAMVVGVFLIYNTIDFLVVQRREQMARLRLHGAQRGELALAVLLEALVFGVIGSLLGLILGLSVAHGLVREVTRTINDLYFVVSVREVALPPLILLGNVVMGILAAVVAAVVPAIAAMRSRPHSGLSTSALSDRSGRMVPGLAACGSSVLLLAWALLHWKAGGIIAGFAVMALVIAGWAMVVPFMLAVASWILARPMGWALGPLAVIATRAMRASLGRTGVAVAALSVAIAASLGVGVMVDSFRRALVVWLDSTLRADVYITAPRAVAARINEMALDPALLQTLSQVPGVSSVIVKRDAHPMSALGRIDLTAFDIPPSIAPSFTLLSGEPSRVWSQYDAGGILVSEPFVARHHCSTGDTLQISTDLGIHGFLIAGVVKDFSNDQGVVLISMQTYHRYWSDRGISALSAFAQSGVSPQELVRRMRASASPHLLQIDSNQDLRRESLAVFDHTFAVTQVIRVLAGSVAFIGVLSALLALILERRREVAMLRMYGCTRFQVASLLTTQALLTGLVAGVLALPLGILLADLLIDVINRRSFGWSFALHVSPASLLVAVGLSVAAAALAVIVPAALSARIPPATALRRE